MTSELLSEKDHLTMILENLEEGILELSRQGKIVTANKAAQKILGSSEEKLIGVALGDIVGWGSHQETICWWVDKQLACAGMKSHDIYEDSPIIIEDRVVTALFMPVIQSDNLNTDSIKVKTTGAGGGKGRVLLIEPQEQMSEIGQIMLNHLGFSVTAVNCRSDALRELKNMKENSLLSKPLVIMDIGGADDVAAVETCRLLHEIDSELQVIAATGGSAGPVVENCQLHGFVNILPKPYSIDCLSHVTSRAL